MLRVILDTNVRYSSIGFAGLPREVARFCQPPNCLQIISPDLLAELRKTLLRRYAVPAVERAVLDLESALLIDPGITIDACRDPDDNRVLECAVAGRAEIIISGDKDLLTLTPFRGVRILTPRQFYDEFVLSSAAQPLP